PDCEIAVRPCTGGCPTCGRVVRGRPSYPDEPRRGPRRRRGRDANRRPTRSLLMTRSWISAVLFCVPLSLCGGRAFADAPVAAYVFPAGGQRGTTVKVRVGGLCLYDKCHWELCGPGVTSGKHLT